MKRRRGARQFGTPAFNRGLSGRGSRRKDIASGRNRRPGYDGRGVNLNSGERFFRIASHEGRRARYQREIRVFPSHVRRARIFWSGNRLICHHPNGMERHRPADFHRRFRHHGMGSLGHPS